MDTWMLQCLLPIKGNIILTSIEVTFWKMAVTAFDLTGQSSMQIFTTASDKISWEEGCNF